MYNHLQQKRVNIVQYRGKNILSYKLGTVFTGKEIKEWIQFQLDNETYRSSVARDMKKYLNISDEGKYVLYKDEYWASASYGQYLVRRVDKASRILTEADDD